MLTIYFGDMDGVIDNTSVYFNNTYSAAWLEDPLAQGIIKSVDKGDVLGPNAIETKILGIIPPEKLSSGTKTLLLLLFDAQNVYNATNCGDNCARWILRISRQHDITINLHHLMNFGNGRFTARVGNTGQTVHTMDELVLIGADCLRGIQR
ncbi:DUF4869 domain-containing protein [uncultured Parolsenella sp.]|uniref:DUF4869 domain-containing protein n=1 Tax=uncultured Parolsenella sp. TaxID=2083008 RepID=UPI0025E318FD|nr:DUF4869 domain-containing protein [uncultured Parolsenella sp.]